MNINIEEIPFSRKGSYFVLSYLEKQQCIVLRDIHGGDMSPSELFLLKIDGKNSDLAHSDFKENYFVEVTETHFRLMEKGNHNHRLEIILPTARTLRMRSKGLAVSFEAVKERYDTFYQLTEDRYEYISYKKDQRYQFALLSGALETEAPWHEVGNPSVLLTLDSTMAETELVIVNDKLAPVLEKDTLGSFAEEEQKLEEEFISFKRALLKDKQELGTSDDMSAYLLWACQVHKEKVLTRDSLYMSKNWMQNIWSWDNCFSALGIASVAPELAYDQFQIFIDHQDETGVYPDFINDVYASFSCVKPPIHAWAYQRLMEQNEYFAGTDRLKQIYGSIAASTTYWLKERCHPASGLLYYSHGNDSGWDNASIFKAGMAVSSPDLIAYLAYQCQILSDWSKNLGLLEESRSWEEQSQRLQQLLMTRYYNKEKQQFVALDGRTGAELPFYDSLILYMPLLLGKSLSTQQREPLVEQLLNKFEGTYGLGTESQQSQYYRQDGYWLGPIWAPVSYILISSLRAAGYEEDAVRLAEKFCKLTEVGGMAENFNPESGKGNDDLAFAWTSSVYLMLSQNNF